MTPDDNKPDPHDDDADGHGARGNADLSALIRDNATRYTADPMLAASIRAEMAMRTVGTERPRAVAPPRWPAGWWLGAGLVGGALASVLVVTLIGATGLFNQRRGGDPLPRASMSWPAATPALPPVSLSPSEQLANELISNHLRSLMVAHLNDIASTDQHTVKPWFQGKLDYAPPVPDFVDDGFSLVGGRLDLLEGRVVAALVYRRGQHVINVFVRPAATAAPLTETLRAGISRRGMQVMAWESAGMHTLAVSDANAIDLAMLGRLWQRSLP